MRRTEVFNSRVVKETKRYQKKFVLHIINKCNHGKFIDPLHNIDVSKRSLHLDSVLVCEIRLLT